MWVSDSFEDEPQIFGPRLLEVEMPAIPILAKQVGEQAARRGVGRVDLLDQAAVLAALIALACSLPGVGTPQAGAVDD